MPRMEHTWILKSHVLSCSSIFVKSDATVAVHDLAPRREDGWREVHMYRRRSKAMETERPGAVSESKAALYVT